MHLKYPFNVALRVKDGKACFDSSLLACIKTCRIDYFWSIFHIFEESHSNLVDHSGATLLHYAAKFSNAALATHFIDSKYDVNAVDNFGQTPLLVAVKSDSIFTFQVLLNANANTHIPDSEGRNMLIEALSTSRHKLLLILIIVDTMKSKFSSDKQLLVQKLFGLNITLENAIHLEDSDLMRLMLKYGHSGLINDKINEDGDTALLHLAANMKDLKNVRVLLEHGADVNVKNQSGFTPICYCNEGCRKSLEILKALIEYTTSLPMSLSNDNMRSIAFLFYTGRKQTIRTLLQYVDLFSRDEGNRKPLHYLILNKNHRILDCMRGQKFDVNAYDRLQDTALHLAVREYSVAKVQFLLENNATVNVANENGETPLSCLISTPPIRGVSYKIVQLLLQYGADVQRLPFEQTDFEGFFLVQPVLAHLAMIESQGQELLQFSQSLINFHIFYENYFMVCKRQLEEMKRIEIHESVTLYKLLVEDPVRISFYARNRTFVANFKNIMKFSRRKMNSYYTCTLYKRVGKCIQTSRSKLRTASMVSQLIRLKINNFFSIVYEIADYLDAGDLQNMLCACEDLETELFTLDKFF